MRGRLDGNVGGKDPWGVRECKMFCISRFHFVLYFLMFGSRFALWETPMHIEFRINCDRNLTEEIVMMLLALSMDNSKHFLLRFRLRQRKSCGEWKRGKQTTRGFST